MKSRVFHLIKRIITQHEILDHKGSTLNLPNINEQNHLLLVKDNNFLSNSSTELLNSPLFLSILVQSCNTKLPAIISNQVYQLFVKKKYSLSVQKRVDVILIWGL